MIESWSLLIGYFELVYEKIEINNATHVVSIQSHMAIRYYIDQIEGLFQPIESTYTIHDVMKVGDDVYLILHKTTDQTEVSIKVEDMYFNTWYSCPFGYYMKYVQAIGCDEPLENLHSIS